MPCRALRRDPASLPACRTPDLPCRIPA